ncbi:hypothetical protein [Rhizobium rhizogenes]|uniref:hypothetical protein n=1 Tax=Rhizobium rhizogenes TaxID=359 RepID=UPI001572FE47|nr:hypothetical protein [Rhizobium rhizogenes]NTF83982.1 hypothetical protein [Rhizobium rhizogenes]
MKKLLLTLSIGFASLSAVAYAADATKEADGSYGDELPPGIRAILDLGRMGLMESYFSNEAFGTAQGRIGRARATYGVAASPTSPKTGYSESNVDAIADLSVMKMIGPESFLRLTYERAQSFGDGSIVEVDSTTHRLDAQLVNLPSVDTMFAFGVFAEGTDIEIRDVGDTSLKGWGMRFDAIKKLSDHWGVTLRAEDMFGVSDIAVSAGPAGIMTHSQDDNRLYVQSELIGRFTKSDFAPIPDNWALQPIVGALFMRHTIESTANNFGVTSAGVSGSVEDYGYAWAKLKLARDDKPNVWAPQFTLGIGTEYLNDLNAYINEPAFGLVGAGLSRVTNTGGRFDFRFSGAYGFTAKRNSNALSFSFNQTF